MSPDVSVSGSLSKEVNSTRFFIHTYILVHVYLPVAFLSDWDPVDGTFVERMVYSPQNQLTTILGVFSSESRKQFNTDMGVCQQAPVRLHLKSKRQITALSKFRYGWLKRTVPKLSLCMSQLRPSKQPLRRLTVDTKEQAETVATLS